MYLRRDDLLKLILVASKTHEYVALTEYDDPSVAQKAVDYIVTQECPSTGLSRSWSGDPETWAWLYDQALA